jgi:hypothetical protein
MRAMIVFGFTGWGVADLNPSSTSPADIPPNSIYDPDTKLNVLITNCSFSNNSYPLSQQVYNPGMIHAENTYNNISITNTLFYNNDYNDIDISPNSYSMMIEYGNKISLHNNCFFDNNFIGDGVVITNETHVTSSSNNFLMNNTIDATQLDCTFNFDVKLDTCVASDTMPILTTCNIDNMDPIPDKYKPLSTTTSSSSPTLAPISGGVVSPPTTSNSNSTTTTTSNGQYSNSVVVMTTAMTITFTNLVLLLTFNLL